MYNNYYNKMYWASTSGRCFMRLLLCKKLRFWFIKFWWSKFRMQSSHSNLFCIFCCCCCVFFCCWGKSNVCKVCTNPNAASKIVKDFHIFVQIKDTHSTVSAFSRFIEYVFIRLYNIWCKLNIWLILVLIIYKF